MVGAGDSVKIKHLPSYFKRHPPVSAEVNISHNISQIHNTISKSEKSFMFSWYKNNTDLNWLKRIKLRF
jgi:hypothetical protein